MSSEKLRTCFTCFLSDYFQNTFLHLVLILHLQAARASPSVIFFDELDGLAPERSTKNEQIHCSVVTTLLALMDGLDRMPGVIVIGATNRIDYVDPALRRPGRFDKELYFPLPCTQSRKEILQVTIIIIECFLSNKTNKNCNQYLLP